MRAGMDRFWAALGLIAVVAAAGAMTFWGGGCEGGGGTSATAPATRAARPAQTPVLAANTVLHADVPYGGPDVAMDVLDVYAPKGASGARWWCSYTAGSGRAGTSGT